MNDNVFSNKLSNEVKINELYYEEMYYPKNKTLDELFCEQAQKTPDNIAIISGQQRLCYNELNYRTDVLANTLRNMGVNRNRLIGILCEQSLELIIGMIAILKAGGAFLVIDPHYPKERINFLLEDSRVDSLLTKSDYLEGIKFNNQIIDFDIYNDNFNANSYLTNIRESSDLAYIVYTSGTTGIPKAAMIEHRNLINALYYLKSQISVNSSTRVIQYFNPSFSVSYQEIFVTLLFGGTLHIINENIKRNIGKLLDFISKEEINTLFLPVSFLKLIINDEKYYSRLSNTIKQIITAGEQLILSENFIKFLTYNEIECYNNFGTSETNVAAMLNIKNLDSFDNISPVGKPIANTYIYILNENLELQPIGNEGQIYISGDSVGKGYLNNPELTSEKFIKNPFLDGKVMYKTGDLGKWLPDGNIQLLGRLDYQIKVRGFRIELEEIEYNLLKHPLIKEAIVVAKQGISEDKFLYAYIMSDRPILSDEVKKFLSSKIPDYMMPAYIIRLNEFPRTFTGKIDRKALIENRTVLLDNNETQSYNSNYSVEHMIIFNEIKIILESICKNELININLDDDFTKLGLDSISFLKLAADIENKFGFVFNDDEISNDGCQTINELIACIEEKNSFLNGGKYGA